MTKIPLYQQIKNYLLNLIKENADIPNLKLPSENQLAIKFNASRMAAKNAMAALEQEGIIYRIQGKGTFAKQPSLFTETLTPDTRWVGILIPSLDSDFIKQIVFACYEVFFQRNVLVHILYTKQDSSLETKLIQNALSNNCSGMIAIPIDNEYYSPEILHLSLKNFPTVLADRKLEGLNLPSITTDHFNAAYALTKQIPELGHKHILFIGTDNLRLSSVAERILGYTKALEEANLPAPYLPLDAQNPDEFTNKIKERLQQSNITAIITTSGIMESAFYRAAVGLNQTNILCALFDSEKKNYHNEERDFKRIRLLQDTAMIGTIAAESLYDKIFFDMPIKNKTISFKIVNEPNDQ